MKVPGVLALIAITQWSEARCAATPIDARAWLAHLIDRLTRSRRVTRAVVVCHPDCLPLVLPHVPAGVEIVSSADAMGWAATAGGADLVARVPVWQLFADPARLDYLADAPRGADATRVHAVDEHDAAIDLTGGAFVEIVTRRGCQRSVAGIDAADGEVVGVPCSPDPPELRLRPADDTGWGVTLQRALLAEGLAGDLSAVDGVVARARLTRFDFWGDGVGAGPTRVLTVRCLPAAPFARLLAHLRHLPSATIDVLCPSSLAEATAAMPGVHGVVEFEGPSFDLQRLGPAALDAMRRRRYDLCVVPRRTPCGRGFENLSPLAVASGAATAVWMDIAGRTGPLAGHPRGWEPWVTDAPPWRDAGALRERAYAALRALVPDSTPADPEADPAALAAEAAAAVIARMDECVACHALVDAVDPGIELAPLLLYQLPSIVAAHAAVARLGAQGRPVAPRLGTLVDRVLAQGVAMLAGCAPGADAGGRGDEVRRAGDALGVLADRIERATDGSSDEAEAVASVDAVARALAASRPMGGSGVASHEGRA